MVRYFFLICSSFAVEQNRKRSRGGYDIWLLKSQKMVRLRYLNTYDGNSLAFFSTSVVCLFFLISYEKFLTYLSKITLWRVRESEINLVHIKHSSFGRNGAPLPNGSDLTDTRFEPRTSRFQNESVSAQSNDRFCKPKLQSLSTYWSKVKRGSLIWKGNVIVIPLVNKRNKAWFWQVRWD